GKVLFHDDVPALPDGEGDERRRHLPCVEHGCDGGDPPGLLPGRGSHGRLRHSPASMLSDRFESRSRSRVASTSGRPGICASEEAEAVWRVTVAMPYFRASGPESTSTYCIRPYGTSVSDLNMIPRRTASSSQSSQ